MVEGADPGQASEAGRLTQKSAEAFDLAAEAAADPSFKETKLEEAQELAGDSALAAAYTHLQQIVGVIAVSLPFVLIIGNRALSGDELETSISAYYHTTMGGVFVGALCALAVFFLSYNYKPLPGFNLDNKLSTLAAIAALGVAFFPTTSDASVSTQSEQVVGRVHLTFAGLLFALLAVFALFLFPRSGGAKTAAKKHRNIVYRTCGVVIVVCDGVGAGVQLARPAGVVARVLLARNDLCGRVRHLMADQGRALGDPGRQADARAGLVDTPGTRDESRRLCRSTRFAPQQRRGPQVRRGRLRA